MVLRHSNAKVKLAPAEAKTVLLALTKYLRIPSSPFTRPEGIAFDAVREESLGLGDFYNSEEKTHTGIRFVLDPKGVNPDRVWHKLNRSDMLHERMVDNLLTQVTNALMPEQQRQHQSAVNPSQA